MLYLQTALYNLPFFSNSPLALHSSVVPPSIIPMPYVAFRPMPSFLTSSRRYRTSRLGVLEAAEAYIVVLMAIGDTYLHLAFPTHRLYFTIHPPFLPSSLCTLLCIPPEKPKPNDVRSSFLFTSSSSQVVMFFMCTSVVNFLPLCTTAHPLPSQERPPSPSSTLVDDDDDDYCDRDGGEDCGCGCGCDHVPS